VRHLRAAILTTLKAATPVTSLCASNRIRSFDGKNETMTLYPRILVAQPDEDKEYEGDSYDVKRCVYQIGCFTKESADAAEILADAVEDAMFGTRPKSGDGITYYFRNTGRVILSNDNEHAVHLTYVSMSSRNS